jgi:hypothetical protein
MKTQKKRIEKDQPVLKLVDNLLSLNDEFFRS